MTLAGIETNDVVTAEPRFSGVLAQLAAGALGDRVSVGALLDGLGRSGHGALLVLLGAPNVIPLPVPGLSLLFGVPLLILTAQLFMGRSAPWLPNWVRDRSLSVSDLRRIVGVVVPKLEKVEKLVKPRLAFMTSAGGRVALGGMGFLLAATLSLPLPLGNALPGLALAMIGLALLERDGVVALSGLILGAVSVAVVTLAGAAVAAATLILVEHLFAWAVG